MLRDKSPSPDPSQSPADESLERAFSFIPLAVYTCDRNGLITMYNEHAAELWGRRPEPNATEERFCGSLRLWHTDGTPLPHNETPMALAIREGHSVRDQEVVVERPDGSIITVSVNIDPLYDENGERVGAINVFGDITLRKHEEEALRYREHQYRELMEGLAVAVYMTDRSGRITLFNEAAVELWGRTPVVGHDPWHQTLKHYSLDGSPLSVDEAPMTVCLREERPVRGEEIVIEREDGTRRMVLPHPTPVWDGDGKMIGAVNVLADLSDRYEVRAREAQVSRLNDELIQTVEELRRASAAKDEFLGMVSHELKNPLTTVLGIARHLEDQHARMDVETVSESLSILSQDASRLAEIIDNMLTLSRAEIDPPDLEPIILSRLVQRTVAEYARRRHQREFVTQLEDDSIVLGHSGWLEQIVLNLLSNAHKYSDSREPIEVAVRRAGADVEISVSDRGPGISDEESERLFQAFVRGVSANSGVYGLGLGLSVCQRLARLMNGEISVRRREEVSGTCAMLRLPVLEE